MSTGWSRLGTLQRRCDDYHERIEYVRFLDGNAVAHTCKPSVKNALAVEMVSICGRVNVPDITIVGGVNDTLSFYDANGALFTVTIPAGTYTFAGLGAALEGLIEAASTGSEKWDGTGYNAVASAFSFVTSKAAAGLAFATGPSTAAVTLGFPLADNLPGKNIPVLGAAIGVERSNCYHLTSDALGRGRRWGINDSDGPTGAMMWTFPAATPVSAVAAVAHYPPNLVSFAWGNTNDIHEFDLNVTCDSDYLLTGATHPCLAATFTGTVCLRFIVARDAEI